MPPFHSRTRVVVAIWCAAILGALALGLYAEPPMLPFGAGRAVPRIAGPPPNLRAWLYMLGVGSVTWFAMLLAAPFMIWDARRIDFERATRPAIAFASILLLTTAVSATAMTQYFLTYRHVQRRPSSPSVALRRLFGRHPARLCA